MLGCCIQSLLSKMDKQQFLQQFQFSSKSFLHFFKHNSANFKQSDAIFELFSKGWVCNNFEHRIYRSAPYIFDLENFFKLWKFKRLFFEKINKIFNLFFNLNALKLVLNKRSQEARPQKHICCTDLLIS